MWKRDEAVRPASGQPTAAPQPPAPIPAERHRLLDRMTSGQPMEKDVVNIGKSVVIKGELNGSEDLTIEGHVEGKIRAARSRAHDRAERPDRRRCLRKR